MDDDKVKVMIDALNEMSESYSDLAHVMKSTADTAKSAKQLWRSKNNSLLIKLGLAMIAFPDPTISDILGAALIAAGTVQMGLKKRTMYVEDIFKTFQNTLHDLGNAKPTV
ncbi:MAG: hypothetical protein QXJ02_02095 [Candidatus Bathyarchaeia archaeon]